MNVPPCSTNESIMAWEAVSSASAPKVMVPSVSSDTMAPELPRFLYFMLPTLDLAVESLRIRLGGWTLHAEAALDVDVGTVVGNLSQNSVYGATQCRGRCSGISAVAAD